MAITVRFLKPVDLRATLRGVAIMAALFDKHRDCRFWRDAERRADIGLWSDLAGHEACFYFTSAGSLMLGFDSESPMKPQAGAEPQPWPGIFEELPGELLSIVQANPFGEGFRREEVTFCLWNESKGFDWSKGEIEYPRRELGDPDGSEFVMGKFRDFFDNFEEEVAELYGKEFDPDLLYRVFADEPLTQADLKRLKPDLSLVKVRPALHEIGVPL